MMAWRAFLVLGPSFCQLRGALTAALRRERHAERHTVREGDGCGNFARKRQPSRDGAPVGARRSNAPGNGIGFRLLRSGAGTANIRP